jgi:predicted 3-demethylubiquinone-9 3-methyltransferase (glyoxalase superfamily)
MSTIAPCLWFDGVAEEAAMFYSGLFPDSRITAISRAASDTPSNRRGDVITVEFELFGQRYIGLNGGPQFPFTEAISLQVECDDQAEVDRYWDALVTDGEESMCGWLKDRYGLSWQIVPRRLHELLAGADPAASERAMRAMLGMRRLDIAALEAAYAG